MFNIVKKFFAFVAGLFATAAAFSQATPIDVSAATDGISAAQVAVLAVLAAMIVMAAAVYGVKKVLRLLGR